jgi:hypothetical protein
MAPSRGNGISGTPANAARMRNAQGMTNMRRSIAVTGWRAITGRKECDGRTGSALPVVMDRSLLVRAGGYCGLISIQLERCQWPGVADV